MNKILFSTTSFDTIDNGPALFANILYNNLIDNEKKDLRILTENVDLDKHPRKYIYKLSLTQTRYNRFFYQFFRIFKYHTKAKEISKIFEFDILVYNNAFTGFWSSINYRKPVVVMINDYNRIDFIQRGFSFNKNYFKNFVLFYLEKIAAKKSELIIVNSQFLKAQICKMYKIPEKQVKVLYKGINLTKFNFRLRENYSGTIKILFIKGGFVNGGFYDLIEALQQLKEYDFKVTIIGPRDIDLPKIRKTIIESGIDKFEVYGALPPAELKAFFRQADIFCVPSHKEALGVANMEALATGIPVVSTNVGGIPEVLQDGKCGWMVDPENPKMLAVAIKECIENPEVRLKKSKLGQQHVQQFNSVNLINNFLYILDEVK